MKKVFLISATILTATAVFADDKPNHDNSTEHEITQYTSDASIKCNDITLYTADISAEDYIKLTDSDGLVTEYKSTESASGEKFVAEGNKVAWIKGDDLILTDAEGNSMECDIENR